MFGLGTSFWLFLGALATLIAGLALLLLPWGIRRRVLAEDLPAWGVYLDFGYDSDQWRGMQRLLRLSPDWVPPKVGKRWGVFKVAWVDALNGKVILTIADPKLLAPTEEGGSE